MVKDTNSTDKLNNKLNKICAKLDKLESKHYPAFLYETIVEYRMQKLYQQKSELESQLNNK